jgi:hypothetical protein
MAKASEIAAKAARQLKELTGKETEAVIGLDKNENGWVVTVEVLELQRTPNTTDLLSSYEVHVDNDGDLEEYRRLNRYVRGAAEGQR